ncbi:2508_t:CDS:2, partial [Gigaspora rosea]
ALLLSENELLGIKELVNLLEPFAHATSLMSELEMKLKLNIADRWKDPKIEGYLAALLDPRFKNLEFAPEKFEETKKYLKQKMQALNENVFVDEQLIAKPLSKLASFFNSTNIVNKASPVDTELKAYFEFLQMRMYDANDPEYKTENPLSW